VFRYRALRERRGLWPEFDDPAASRIYRDLLATLRPDVVHVHHWIGLTSQLVMLASAQGIPAVVTLHDTWTVCPRIFRLKEDSTFCADPYHTAPCLSCAPHTPWEGNAVREGLLAERQRRLLAELHGAAALIAPSVAHREFIARVAGIAPGRIEVLPHPSLARVSAPPPTGPVAARPFRIGCWGALAPHKGQDTVLRALPWLPPAPPWELHVYGLAVDARFEAKLRELAEGYPVSFHGLYDPRELGDAQLDLAVFPSLAPESFSFGLDEALQLGLPLIVSDRGALAERAGPAALVVPAGDAEALGHTLRRLLETPALLAELRSRVRPQPPLELDPHVDRLEAIYRAVGSAPILPRRAPEPDVLGELRHRQVLELERAWQGLDQARATLLGELAALRRELEGLREQAHAEASALRDQIRRLEASNFELTHSRGFSFLSLVRELRQTIGPAGLRELFVHVRAGDFAALGRHALARSRRLVRLASECARPGRTAPPPRPGAGEGPAVGRPPADASSPGRAAGADH
jgi:glycosyltransferase involved in cell wall biosynthesis